MTFDVFCNPELEYVFVHLPPSIVFGLHWCRDGKRYPKSYAAYSVWLGDQLNVYLISGPIFHNILFFLRATFRDRRPQPYGTKRQFEVEEFFLRTILIINFECSLEIFWYLSCTLYMWTCEGGDWEKRNFGVWGTRHWEAHGRNSSGIIWIFSLNILKTMEGIVKEYLNIFVHLGANQFEKMNLGFSFLGKISQSFGRSKNLRDPS